MEAKLQLCCFQTNGVVTTNLSGSQVNSENVKLLRKVVEAAKPLANLFVFPELFLCGYNIGEDVKERAEYPDGPSFQVFDLGTVICQLPQKIAAIAKEFG